MDKQVISSNDVGAKEEVEFSQAVLTVSAGSDLSQATLPSLDPHEQAFADTAFVELHVSAWRQDRDFFPDGNEALKASRKRDNTKIGV